jgi:tryptophan 2,3-dioxygenase
MRRWGVAAAGDRDAAGGAGARRGAAHAAHPGIVAAWTEVYRAPGTHWELYELAEKLVDFEDYFRRWRFNHVTTVERVIGFKRGTGGTGASAISSGCSRPSCSPNSGT